MLYVPLSFTVNEAVNYVILYVKSVDIGVAKMQVRINISQSSSAGWDLIMNIETSHQRLAFISTFVPVKY